MDLRPTVEPRIITPEIAEHIRQAVLGMMEQGIDSEETAERIQGMAMTIGRTRAAELRQEAVRKAMGK